MRRALLPFVFLPPLAVTLPFVACSSSSPLTPDAGAEGGGAEGGGQDSPEDASFSVDAGATTHCTLGGADPVGLCVEKAALTSLHAHAFHGMTGATASWSYVTGVPDKGDAGLVSFTATDTVAYAAAASNYLSNAALYGDTTLTATLTADLTAIALLLETSALAPATNEYSGEYYAHLRTTAVGLRSIGLTTDGNHVDKLADAYGAQIYAHYVPLGLVRPDAGPAEAGTPDASAIDASLPDAGLSDATTHDGGHDAAPAHDAAQGHDATVDSGPKSTEAGGDARLADGEVPCPDVDAGAPNADGIIGNLMPGGGVLYAPADVATAAYALLDLASRSPRDCRAAGWLAAVRASLNHLEAQAREPSTGMYYRALVAAAGDSGAADVPAPSTDPALPSDAVLADTQATFALAMIRAQYLATTSTHEIDAGRDGAIFDAGVVGPLVPILDYPFEARADQAIAAMNGAHSLWDGPVTCPKPTEAGVGACRGSAPGHGYMDGYVPSTGSFITTKSTRPNAFMAGAIWRGVETNVNPYGWQLPSLVPLLIAVESATIPAGSNLITVVPSQQAYFQTVSQAFTLLDAGPDPRSYTTEAVSAAVEGLTEQLFGRPQ